MSRLGEMLHGGPVDGAEVARVRGVVMFEEPDLKARLVRFSILLVLAAAISTFGLYADSVATVIGAMIVAPLMLPIMGLAFGIAIADRRAIGSSLLVSIGGIAASIAVGYLLSMIMPSSLDPTTNSQIMARTAPRLIDLLAALATGLAGAFAIGRKDVSDTLPGVAIAISLVPPLANVGILLGAGREDLASGSMLLFMTNYFAIVLTGALVFGLMGFPRAVHAASSPRVRRIAIAVVIAMVVLITLPLGLGSARVIFESLAVTNVAAATNEWLAGSGYHYVSATTDAERVSVVVTGSGELPERGTLEESLKGKTYGLPVSVEVVPSNSFSFETR